jgi:hypothetical protein
MLVSNVIEYLRQVATRGPDAAFRQQMTVGHMVGTMFGYYKRPRQVPPS